MIRFTLRIPNKIDCQLKKIAEEQGRSKSDLIKVACWELVEQYEKKKRTNNYISNEGDDTYDKHLGY